MAEKLFRPIPVKYTGLYSDDHLIDLEEFGTSLQGLARVSNSVVDFYLHGKIAKDRRTYQVRLFASPPEPGCVILDIVAIINAGQLPLYAPLLCELATKYVIPLIKATIATRIKRPDVAEIAIEEIANLANRYADFAEKVHDGHMLDKAWLRNHVDTLAKKNAVPLKQLVNPVGSTCREITIGIPDDPAPVRIGEAEAQALSSPEELSVEDVQEFRGVFEGVDKTNGSCKFRVQGTEREILGKITDPALGQTQNVYTHSLDTQTPVLVTAKAVTKNDAIVKLFISDGKAT